MKNRIIKGLESNIEVINLEIKPNEIVCIYQGDKLIGHAIGEGNLWIDYDKSSTKLRVERIYIP
jgi:hypothetical protein